MAWCGPPMDPLTHSLVGAALAKTRVQSLAPDLGLTLTDPGQIIACLTQQL